MSLPSIQPPRQRAHHKRRPAASLVMIAAQFRVGGGGSITITFDRYIDIAAINPGAVRVVDGVTTLMSYVGSSAIAFGPGTVKIFCTSTGSVPAGTQILNAGANSGIVAVNDGGTWAGAVNVGLPFTG